LYEVLRPTAWFLQAVVFHYCEIKHPLLPTQEDQKSARQACPATKDYFFICKFVVVVGECVFTAFLPEQRGGISKLPFQGRCLADSPSRTEELLVPLPPPHGRVHTHHPNTLYLPQALQQNSKRKQGF